MLAAVCVALAWRALPQRGVTQLGAHKWLHRVAECGKRQHGDARLHPRPLAVTAQKSDREKWPDAVGDAWRSIVSLGLCVLTACASESGGCLKMSGVLRRPPAGLVALSRHTRTRAKGRNPCPGKSSSAARPFSRALSSRAVHPESKLAIFPPGRFGVCVVKCLARPVQVVQEEVGNTLQIQVDGLVMNRVKTHFPNWLLALKRSIFFSNRSRWTRRWTLRRRRWIK